MNKRINKTKEEIISHMQNVGKAKVQRKFVKEKFFPALCDATNSITDADMFLQSFSSMIMDTFLNLMKEKKFGEFDFVKKLDQSSPKFEEMKKLVSLFNDITLRESQDLIEGLKKEIQYFYRKELQSRKLESIDIEWIDDEKNEQ
jgi:hypothetical protein